MIFFAPKIAWCWCFLAEKRAKTTRFQAFVHFGNLSIPGHVENATLLHSHENAKSRQSQHCWWWSHSHSKGKIGQCHIQKSGAFSVPKGAVVRLFWFSQKWHFGQMGHFLNQNSQKPTKTQSPIQKFTEGPTGRTPLLCIFLKSSKKYIKGSRQPIGFHKFFWMGDFISLGYTWLYAPYVPCSPCVFWNTSSFFHMYFSHEGLKR